MSPEEELLEELQRKLSSAGSQLEVQPSSAEYFVVLQERFPVYGSKIDWESVPGARIESIDTADSENYFERAEIFANEVWNAEGIDCERSVVVIGDSAMDVALKMPLHALRSCLRRILAMPQHSYVLASDASWCMSFTMEGDVSFAYAPDDADR